MPKKKGKSDDELAAESVASLNAWVRLHPCPPKIVWSRDEWSIRVVAQSRSGDRRYIVYYHQRAVTGEYSSLEAALQAVR